MSTVEFDTKLHSGLGVALDHARQLGYDIESMKVTLTLQGGTCRVYFAPLSPPGSVTMGGDLIVRVDTSTLQVLDFERGQ